MSGNFIKRALVSVSNKDDLVPFARMLLSFNVEILSTGGTADMLRDWGITVKDVSDYTGFPEILDGRVKTLHPKIHGGILGMRDDPKHRATWAEHGIEPIDMVVVNLYPFEQTVAKPGCTHEEAIENIDIGGPTMLRAAAKNYRNVTPIVDTSDYARIGEEMSSTGGFVSMATNRDLAAKAFRHTRDYDAAIDSYLNQVIQDKKESV